MLAEKNTNNTIQSINRMTDFSSRDFRNAMGLFATGVVVISNHQDGGTHAMTANAFMSGSLEPPLIVVSVDHKARMHKRLEESELFGVSLLSAGQQPTSNHFAGKVSPDHQPVFVDVMGVPVLGDSPLTVVAELRHTYPCGDHTLFVGEVKALECHDEQCRPLLFHKGRYADLYPLN